MRIFAQKQNQPQKQISSSLARSNSHSIMRLQRTIGNQAVLRLLQAESPSHEASSSSKEVSCFAHGVNSSGPHTEMPRVQGLLGNRQFQQFFDDKPKGGKTKSGSGKPPSREPCDNSCGTSGGPYGNTECEFDLKSGLLTGKVTKEIFDKNPCTRPCVNAHEGVHAKQIAPLCAAAKKCLDAAGGDEKKQDKCLDKHQADMDALTFSTECAAYTADQECLRKRAKKAECRNTDGKMRWDEQMKMVKCYKGCFCKG